MEKEKKSVGKATARLLKYYLGHVCFLKFTFRETTFQTFQIFPCLFVIKKVGQRKTLSGQRETLSSQRKFWFGF
jgi:hypothetical protein